MDVRVIIVRIVGKQLDVQGILTMKTENTIGCASDYSAHCRETIG